MIPNFLSLPNVELAFTVSPKPEHAQMMSYCSFVNQSYVIFMPKIFVAAPNTRISPARSYNTVRFSQTFSPSLLLSHPASHELQSGHLCRSNSHIRVVLHMY
jgi:hypothetical protein